MMTLADVAFVRKHYGDAIKWDANGFYYENADSPPARFYFETFAEAAADLATEIGVTDDERASVDTEAWFELQGNILEEAAKVADDEAMSGRHNPWCCVPLAKEIATKIRTLRKQKENGGRNDR